MMHISSCNHSLKTFFFHLGYNFRKSLLLYQLYTHIFYHLTNIRGNDKKDEGSVVAILFELDLHLPLNPVHIINNIFVFVIRCISYNII